MSKEKNIFKKRKGYLSSASDILQDLLQDSKSPVGAQFTRWKLWTHWDSVVGSKIAKYTAPIGYSKGCLYVWVKHPTHMQNLIFITQSLQSQINKFIGQSWVRSIRFTLNQHQSPEEAHVKKNFQKLVSNFDKGRSKEKEL